MQVTGSSRSTGQAAASTEASTNSDKKKIAYKCVIRNSPGSLPLSVRATTPQPQRDQSDSLKQSVKQSCLAAVKSKWRV